MALIGKDGQPVRSKETGRVVIIHHKDKKQESDEKKLQALMLEHRPACPIQGPIKLGVKAFFEVPKSKPKWFREAARLGEIQPETKPDLDNVLKHVKDCATGIFWEDDKQVVGYLDDTGKYYGSPARYEITLLFRRDRQNAK